MRIVCFVFLSNHFHLLVLPTSAHQLATFMAYLLSNVAREVGRSHDWRDRFWARRYQAIVVSDEAGAQVDRLRYLLSHGAKEALVAAPADWPGPHCIDALLTGAPLRGTWVDRTAWFVARRMDLDVSARDFASKETIDLTPLPCWASLSIAARHLATTEILTDIEAEAKSKRQGRPPLGRDAILRQDPHQRPTRCERSPAPSVHAVTVAARRAFSAAYRRFVSAFRRAAARLRAGVRDVEFPAGSFPPRLPFVWGGSVRL